MKTLSLLFSLFSVFGLGISLSSQELRREARNPSRDRHRRHWRRRRAGSDRGNHGRPDERYGKERRGLLPDNAKIVDATGKFLIPGLWDMHIHTLQNGRPELFFPLLLASGVTGVRDPGSPFNELEDVRRLREQIEDGELLGPHISSCRPTRGRPQSDVPGAFHSCH